MKRPRQSKAKACDNLPPKFTSAERKAYQWLVDCGIRGWMVDLLTKGVHTADNTYKNLLEFRDSIAALR